MTCLHQSNPIFCSSSLITATPITFLIVSSVVRCRRLCLYTTSALLFSLRLLAFHPFWSRANILSHTLKLENCHAVNFRFWSPRNLRHAGLCKTSVILTGLYWLARWRSYEPLLRLKRSSLTVWNLLLFAAVHQRPPKLTQYFWSSAPNYTATFRFSTCHIPILSSSHHKKYFVN